MIFLELAVSFADAYLSLTSSNRRILVPALIEYAVESSLLRTISSDRYHLFFLFVALEEQLLI